MEWVWNKNYKHRRTPLRVIYSSGPTDIHFQDASSYQKQPQDTCNKSVISIVADLLRFNPCLSTYEELDAFRVECDYKDWEVIAWMKDEKEGFTGLAFFLPRMGLVVVAYFLKCNEDLLVHRFYEMQKYESKRPVDLAATFIHQVLSIVDYKVCNSLVITGHQLGGWLAQIAYLSGTSLSIRENCFVTSSDYDTLCMQCISFDSPGCLETIHNLNDYYSIRLDDLLLPTIYLTIPNLLNSFSSHWGNVYRIFPSQINEGSIYHPFDTHIKLSTTFTNINAIFYYLRERNSRQTKVLSWPTTFSLDYRDLEAIKTLGQSFQEYGLENDTVVRIYNFKGIPKSYVIGGSQTHDNQLMLQNVYVKFSNLKLYYLSSIIGSDTVKKVPISEGLKIRLNNANDVGREFILNVLPKCSYVHLRSYNIVFLYESLYRVVSSLLGEQTRFAFIESYLRINNDKSCIVTLKTDSNGIIMITGLNSSHIDKLMNEDSFINLSQLLISVSDDSNLFFNVEINQGYDIFEYLCRNNIKSSILWLDLKQNHFLLKCFYDEHLQIMRKYDNYKINDLMKGYETILLYGVACSGKTNEIQNIISKINSWVIYIRIMECTAESIDELYNAFRQKNTKYLARQYFIYHKDDEELISVVLEKCLYSNISKSTRILVCFDGLDLLKSGVTSEQISSRQSMTNLLLYLKSNTRAQLLITARYRTNYLKEIETNMIRRFPSQKLWKGDIGNLDEDEMRNIISRDYQVVNDSMKGKDLFNSVGEIMSKYLPFISNVMLLEASLACLIFAPNGSRSPIDIFELVAFKQVSDYVMQDKVENVESEQIISVISSLKQYLLNKFLLVEPTSLKEKYSDNKEMRLYQTTDNYISILKKSSDYILEFQFIKIFLEKLRRNDTDRANIDDSFNSVLSVCMKMMECVECYSLRALFNEIMPNKFAPLPSSGFTQSKDGTEKKALVNLMREKRNNIIGIFSQIFADSKVDGENALHAAAEIGSEEAANIFIITKKEMVFDKSKNGFTPLHIAAMKNHVSILIKLIDAGAKCEEKDCNGDTSLHLAIKYKSYDAFQEIIMRCKTVIGVANNSGDTPLHVAVACGAVNILEKLLDEGANIEDCNSKGFTCLLIAVNSKRLDIVQVLLERGANKEVKAKSGFSCVHCAAGNNSLDILDYFVKMDNATLKWTTDKNFTPLHVAAVNGFLDAVKLLVKFGADVNVTDIKGRFPLHYAASMGRLEVVKYLIQNDAKVNLVCLKNYTPLHLAAKNGRHSVVDYLMNVGADSSSANFKGLTPIQSAVNNIRYKSNCESMLFDTVKVMLENKYFNIKSETSLLSFGLKQHINFPDWLLQFLIEKTDAHLERTNEGFQSIHFAAYRGDIATMEKLKTKLKSTRLNINSQSLKGYTALYISVAMKTDKEMATLLQWDADSTIQDENGINPFHLACYYGKYTMVDSLAESTPSLVNQLSNDNSSPLHFAAHSGHYDIVTLLVGKYNALLQLTDSKNYSPLHIAAFYGRLGIVQFIVNTESKFIDKITLDGSTPLNLAARRGKFEVVKFLLERGANPDISDCSGYTPLHNAAYQNHANILKLLVKMNSKSLNLKTKSGSTPLYLALKQKNKKSVSTLLELGADVNICNELGFTALHLAALFDDTEIIQTLIDNKAIIDAQDKAGRTPLYIAAWKGHKDSLKVLIERNANISVAQNKGWTPMHVAAYESRLNIVTLLGIKGGPEYINSRTKCGDAPLHFAAWVGNIDIVKWLVEHGTETEIENSFGITPLDLAVSQNSPHLDNCDNEYCQKCYLYNYLSGNGQHLKFMIDFKHINKIESEVIRKRYVNTVEYLATELNANFVDYLPKNKLTPIHVAAEFDCTEILKYFHSRGYDMNVAIPILKETPLYVAVVEDKLASVKTLVELGADMNIGDRSGWTPLHAAVFKNYPHIVSYFCQRSECNINAKTNFDITPLYLGVQYTCKEAVEILFAHNADPLIADQSGWTPLKVAENNQQLLDENKDSNDANRNSDITLMLCLIKEYTNKWNLRKNQIVFPRSIHNTSRS